MSEEGAECVVLVVEDHKGGIRNREDLTKTVHDSLAIFSFGTKNISGTSLTRAGKMCPYHAMNFDRVKNVLQFLDIYKDDLRFGKNLVEVRPLLTSNFAGEGMQNIYFLLMKL